MASSFTGRLMITVAPSKERRPAESEPQPPFYPFSACHQEVAALKLGQLCFDLSLLSQRFFQLSPESEHVNRLKPIPGCLDSPVSFILTAAEIE
ncbi:hypothetical protein [Bradyrhizobium japonicum]|uniref:hypothetical protein n=1 Tax=Bradyrhizobium japonicum TaxID=375 RepID=UPI0022263094|nr:hypothetical protein [Bradyrhizobium japonicum]